MGKAVVTTALGCEGLDVTSGEHLLVADDPGEFADAVIQLLRDDERRARLGAAGRALVERDTPGCGAGARSFRQWSSVSPSGESAMWLLLVIRWPPSMVAIPTL